MPTEERSWEASAAGVTICPRDTQGVHCPARSRGSHSPRHPCPPRDRTHLRTGPSCLPLHAERLTCWEPNKVLMEEDEEGRMGGVELY